MRVPWRKTAQEGQPETTSVPDLVSPDGPAPAELNDSAIVDIEQQASTPANAAADPTTDSLTPRERDVFELLIRGLKMREIADKLGIGYSTVNTHQKSVYKKLGVNSRAECIIRFGYPGKER